MLALHDTCSERPPKIARSHRPWFPAEHLVTQRENLLCATADLLLQNKSDQISKTDQGPALREQGKRTGRPENTVCFMVKKKKKKNSMEKTQVKKNGEQQRLVVAILNTVVRFWQFVILFVFLTTI